MIMIAPLTLYLVCSQDKVIWCAVPAVILFAFVSGVILDHLYVQLLSVLNMLWALQNIHDRVMALGFDESQVDLYTMDSQYSLGNGVIVQVTGALGYKVGLVQTSAPQPVLLP